MRLTVQHSVSLLSTLQLTVPDQVRGKETRLKRHPDSAVGDTRNLTGSQAWGDMEVSQGEDQTLQATLHFTQWDSASKQVQNDFISFILFGLQSPNQTVSSLIQLIFFYHSQKLSVCLSSVAVNPAMLQLHAPNPTNAQVLRGPFLSRK